MKNVMFKKLQSRFVAIAIIALVLIVFIELFAVNVVNVYQHDNDIRSMLRIIAENDGLFPNGSGGDFSDAFWNPFGKAQITLETPYSTRYFVVKLSGDYVTDVKTDNMASVTDQDALRYAASVYKKEPGFGFVDNFRYLFTRSPDGKAIMVFIDFEKDLEATFTLASISFTVGIIFIILFTLPVYLLSKKALEPVKKSIEQQKQFITDAGHELKTPIAIISADVDVLEMCNESEEENEWISSIKNQTKRLDVLVKNLVRLSKLNEYTGGKEHTEFNLSEVVEDTALSFESVAKAKEIRLELNISDGIFMVGDEEEMRQLVSLLCDNALKYVSEDGLVYLSLYKSQKNICLDVYNDCDSVEREKLSKIFDRFYRADESRSRETGGYGIGLSIAKAIVEAHGGELTATTADEKSILFRAVF